jgi:hypothetical protein
MLSASQRNFGGLNRIAGTPMVRAKSFAVPSGNTAIGFLSFISSGNALEIVPSPPPITIRSTSVPCALSSRLRSFLEPATTMSAWEFSENQDDSAGKAASALDAWGLTITNTRSLDFLTQTRL